MLGLSGKNADARTPEGLLGWIPAQLSALARIYRFGIRVCPKCFEMGYHFALFQLVAYKTCPQHGDALIPLATLEGAGGFPSNWAAFPSPSKAKWWPRGYRDPAVGVGFSEIETETRRLFVARDNFQAATAANSHLTMFSISESAQPAATLFEHAIRADDYEDMHGEAYHLFVDLYANWDRAERSAYGKRLHVGCEQVSLGSALWAQLAAAWPVEGRVEAKDRQPRWDELTLSAIVRKEPAARALESVRATWRRTFERSFRSEHGPCFDVQDLRGPTSSIPCVECRAMTHWRQLTEGAWYSSAFDQAVGRILTFMLGFMPVDIAIQLTQLAAVALGNVWSRAQYLAVLARTRRPITNDGAVPRVDEFQAVMRGMMSRALFPPAIVDLSRLPNHVRVHYLASVHGQTIAESDWNPSTRRKEPHVDV